jgi:glucuronate isomerase
MKAFLDSDFLLQTQTAKRLYFDYAAEMPIIDYHNHLPADQIARNHVFENITEIWLKGDHYKWRAMRANGYSEDYISGSKSDYDKFQAWAATVPYTMRNPLYHWTHMELKNPFGITQLLNAQTSDTIWKQTQEQLPQLSTQTLLKQYKVHTLCTTDDPIDSLDAHQTLAQNSDFKTQVYPTFRPDKAFQTHDVCAFNAYMNQLGSVANVSIENFDSWCLALERRASYFHERGCRLSDHGLNHFVYELVSDAAIDTIFEKLRKGLAISTLESHQFSTAALLFLCKLYAKLGWTQQFHVGAIRNNNTRLLNQLGADAGVDSIGDWSMAVAMNRFFDALDQSNSLAQTIVYNLNPADNEVFATMIGNFQDGTVPGKMQYGSGWWFLDQKDGMEKQINALSNMGLLSRFVGMLTDSRSFLSYSRHEYFRRILCNLFGHDVEQGLLPHDEKWLGQMVQDICFNNAKNYFKF